MEIGRITKSGSDRILPFLEPWDRFADSWVQKKRIAPSWERERPSCKPQTGHTNIRLPIMCRSRPGELYRPWNGMRAAVARCSVDRSPQDIHGSWNAEDQGFIAPAHNCIGGGTTPVVVLVQVPVSTWRQSATIMSPRSVVRAHQPNQTQLYGRDCDGGALVTPCAGGKWTVEQTSPTGKQLHGKEKKWNAVWQLADEYSWWPRLRSSTTCAGSPSNLGTDPVSRESAGLFSYTNSKIEL
jgi:hypothetical protein